MELKAFSGVRRRAKTGAGATHATTTVPGFVNGHRQEVVSRTGFASASVRGQVIYKLRCRDCKGEYGANGRDIHHRRCPKCQGGEVGEVLREPAAGLFG